jgi:hypothetical protein
VEKRGSDAADSHGSVTRREHKVFERVPPIPAAGRVSAPAVPARQTAPPAPTHPILKLQRSIGNRAVGRLLQSRASQAPLRVHPPGDSYEREADRVSDAVVQGNGGGRLAALSSVRSVQRDDVPAPASAPDPGRLPPDATALPSDTSPSTADKLKTAAQKTSDALRQTKAGKQLEDEAAQLGKRFVATLEGKVIATAVAGGVLAGLIATDSELPVQLPEIPLDWIAPGLKGKLTYEGKVRSPSKVFLTLTFAPGGGAKKPAQSDSDKFRAETARMAAEQERFRQGLKYVPGSPQDQDRKTEREALEHWAAARLGLEKPLPPPWAVGQDAFARDAWKETWDNYFKARRPTLLPAPSSTEPSEAKPTTSPVMRKETGEYEQAVPRSVEEVLRSPAPGLEPDTRARMEASLGRDFSGVRVHTGPAAAQSAEGIHARAYTVGRDIVFGASQYAPATSEGTRLLAHELTHVVQQSAADTPPQSAAAASSPRFAQPPGTPLETEADVAADRAAAGGRVGAISAAPFGAVQRKPGAKAQLPPDAAVHASLHFLLFVPLDKKAAFHAGSGELQLVAMTVRALLDNDYKPGMEVQVLDALRNLPDGFRITPNDQAGEQKGGEVINPTQWSVPVSLGLLNILNSMGHPAKLSKEKVELLELGQAGSKAFLQVQKLGLPAWYSENLFLNSMAMHAGLLRQFAAAIKPQPAGAAPPDTSAIVQQMFEALKPAALVLEAIRTDGDLIDHPGYRELWPPPKAAPGATAPPVMASVGQEPKSKAGIQFLTYVGTQPDLRDNILGQDPDEARKDRRQILDRFARALGTNLFTPAVAGSGDQMLADEPPASNTPAYPSTLTVYPTIEPPIFDASIKAEYAFELHIQFPDIFAAFQTQHYLFKLYPVPKDKVVGAANKPAVDLDPRKGQTFSNFDRLKGRLAQDSDYNAEDLHRAIHDFEQLTGAPGVGLDTIGLNGLMRYVGSTLKTLIELFTDPRSLKRLRFEKEGLYIVAAFAKPVSGSRAEIVRLPTAAYLPVFARDPRVIAESRVQQALEAQSTAQDRIVEIVAKLADKNVPHRDELLKELSELQAQTGGVQQLLTFQRKSLQERKTDKKNPPSAKEIEQIDARIKAIDRILEVRADRGLDVGTERLMAVLVSDNGQIINLMLEVVNRTKAGETEQTWFVADATTPSGHQGKGTGKDRLEAIRLGVKQLLEKGSYGRGQVSVTVDKVVLNFRVAADSAAQMNEALANMALLLSIAAVAAAPFTAGASLSLLIPAGVIGAIPSAYRLAERSSEHTLRFDMEAAMDVVNIVGAVVGLGAETQLAARSLWMGRALLVAGVGAAGTGMVLMGAQLMEQIEALQDLPAGMRAAQLTQILGNAMLQAGIMLGGALMAKSRVGETMRSVEERESSFAKWRDESLDKPTREELDKHPAAKASYAEMSEVVRNLLTLCGSFCAQIDPPPTKAQVKRIENLVDKLGSASDQRWLKGYLHENRGKAMNKALERLEKVPADKLSKVLRGMVTDPSIVVLMAFSEEFRTPAIKKAAEALMNKGTLPVEQIGGILDKVRRQRGGNPERMLRYLDKIGDHKPTGYEAVLRDLEIGGSLHKGAEWVLRFLCDSAGDLIAKVSKFEEEAEPGGRRWDFVIDGQRFQLKSWSRFYEDTFLRQMLEDYRQTGEFQTGVVKWVFDDTTGLGGKSDIIGIMGESLDRAAGTVDGYSRTRVERIIRRLPEIVSVGLR